MYITLSQIIVDVISQIIGQHTFIFSQILALALGIPGPTRAPKAIQAAVSDANRNSLDKPPSPGSPSEPIIIDLLPFSPSLGSSSTSTTRRYTEAATIATTRSSITSTTTTTRAPVVITAKPVTTARPKVVTTTQASAGIGVSLWQALFGGNGLLGAVGGTRNAKPARPASKAVTASRPIQVTATPTRVVKSTASTDHITPSATPSGSHTTARSADIRASSTNSFADSASSASVTTPTNAISATAQTTLLNNPNPRLSDISTSTYSPEDDAKFLATLLRAIETGENRYLSLFANLSQTKYRLQPEDDFSRLNCFEKLHN